MPVNPTYPGVYVEEVPSGVRTIVGVPTAVTAFVGRAKRGPVDEPIILNGYGDYERSFGGLWKESSLGYAVRDFFMNGGAQAVVVRLFEPGAADDGGGDGNGGGNGDGDGDGDGGPDGDGGGDGGDGDGGPDGNGDPEPAAADEEAADLFAALSVDGLSLQAAYPGSWGNRLRARVDHDTADPDSDDLFNLQVLDEASGAIEQHRNVAVLEDHPRRVDHVLLEDSLLVRTSGDLPEDRPGEHDAPKPGADVWSDETGTHDEPTNTKVADADEATDGVALTEDSFVGEGAMAEKRGLYALLKTDIFNILCIPPYGPEGNVDSGVLDQAAKLCEDRRAILLLDPPADWGSAQEAMTEVDKAESSAYQSRNAALFFPRLRQRDPQRGNMMDTFAPSGAVAGVLARTDAQRGVWKAPAGLDATLNGVPALSVGLTNEENGMLNPRAINCLRARPPAGRVVWGARTRAGDDRNPSEWKYLPVRRLALFIEESLFRGLDWVVFEPNDEPLWSQIRLNVGAFMQNLFRQGAFQGRSPREAYFVKCDKDTTTQIDIDLGKVNVHVGFAPLKPAEFVVLRIQQIAGQLEA